jgi:hypothetical protein
MALKEGNMTFRPEPIAGKIARQRCRRPLP